MSSDGNNNDNSENEEFEIVGDSNKESKGTKESSSKNDELLRKELQQAKNDMLYLRAEFENFKKNTMKERSDLIRYGNERLILELLNVVDVFEQALKTELTPQNIESFRKGVELTAAELNNILGRFGVTRLESLGKPFDPAQHEALAHQPVADAEPGTVHQVFKPAYRLHDRVIRPAQVIVAAPIAPNSESSQPREE
jgi:molecular chaperone GrpE